MDPHSSGHRRIKAPIQYGQVQYWDQRYLNSKVEHFEWLENYQTLHHEIQMILGGNKQAKILHIGCGNSQLQYGLYENGYHNIINIDISTVVIEQMKKQNEAKGYQNMIFQVMDVRNMSYLDGHFDLVLDKSTIDTLMCTENPLINVAKMAEESYRVLKPNGVYFAISYANPEKRLHNITRQNVKWEVEKKQLTQINEDGDPLIHFLYICRKKEMPAMTAQQKEEFYKRLKEIEDKEYK